MLLAGRRVDKNDAVIPRAIGLDISRQRAYFFLGGREKGVKEDG